METINKYEVKTIAWEKKSFIARKATLPIDKLKDFFGQAYGEIYTALGKKGIPGQPPVAIYFSVDEVKQVVDLAAAVPVDGAVEIPGFEKITIPTGKALLLTHYGPYETMRPAYEAIDEYVKKNKLQKGWMLEEYLSDPDVVKNPADWKTNVYCILK